MAGLSQEEVFLRLRQITDIAELLNIMQVQRGEKYPTQDCHCGYCEVARILGWEENERPASLTEVAEIARGVARDLGILPPDAPPIVPPSESK